MKNEVKAQTFKVGEKVLFSNRVHVVIEYDAVTGWYKLQSTDDSLTVAVEESLNQIAAYPQAGTAEELKMQAQQLLDQAATVERQAREQERKEKSNKRQEALMQALSIFGTELAKALNTAGIETEFTTNPERYPYAFLVTEPNIHAELGTVSNRWSDEITGVYVKLGYYGERP